MKIQPKNKKQLLKAALGEIPCDLVITNVQLVNVITGEIYPADIFVYDGFIAHVEYQNVGSAGYGQGSGGRPGPLPDSGSHRRP